LALVALALESSRKKALCDAAYVESSGILEGHADMGYWTRFKRALNAFKRGEIGQGAKEERLERRLERSDRSAHPTTFYN